MSACGACARLIASLPRSVVLVERPCDLLRSSLGILVAERVDRGLVAHVRRMVRAGRRVLVAAHADDAGEPWLLRASAFVSRLPADPALLLARLELLEARRAPPAGTAVLDDHVLTIGHEQFLLTTRQSRFLGTLLEAREGLVRTKLLAERLRTTAGAVRLRAFRLRRLLGDQAWRLLSKAGCGYGWTDRLR